MFLHNEGMDREGSLPQMLYLQLEALGLSISVDQCGGQITLINTERRRDDKHQSQINREFYFQDKSKVQQASEGAATALLTSPDFGGDPANGKKKKRAKSRTDDVVEHLLLALKKDVACRVEVIQRKKAEAMPTKGTEGIPERPKHSDSETANLFPKPHFTSPVQIVRQSAPEDLQEGTLEQMPATENRNSTLGKKSTS